MRTAIYSVLIGPYDEFRGQEYYDPSCDYYLITDQRIEHDVYKTIDVRPYYDHLKVSREYKIIPHILITLGRHRTVYHDASITLHKPIYKYIHDDKFYVLEHPSRSNIWQEFDACISGGKDELCRLVTQRDTYRENGFAGFNLSACGILMRNVSKQMDEFNSRWYREVSRHSHRDQLSFYYAQPPAHEKIPWNSKYFSVRNHAQMGCN